MNRFQIEQAPIREHICLAFHGSAGKSKFWEFRCPCGVRVTYPVNQLPEVDTRMPCGDPTHWAVKYYERDLNATEALVELLPKPAGL